MEQTRPRYAADTVCLHPGGGLRMRKTGSNDFNLRCAVLRCAYDMCGSECGECPAASVRRRDWVLNQPPAIHGAIPLPRASPGHHPGGIGEEGATAGGGHLRIMDPRTLLGIAGTMVDLCWIPVRLITPSLAPCAAAACTSVLAGIATCPFCSAAASAAAWPGAVPCTPPPSSQQVPACAADSGASMPHGGAMPKAA